MPIPREQFDKGLGERDLAIVQLLQGAPDKAFSFEEIAKAVGVAALEVLDRLSLAWALYNLVQKGRVEYKTLDGMTYYAASRSRGTL